MNQAKISGIFKQDYAMVAGFNGLVYQIGCCYVSYKQGIEIECTKENKYSIKGEKPTVTSVWKKAFSTDHYKYYNVEFKTIVIDGYMVDVMEIYGIATDDSVVKVLVLNVLSGTVIEASIGTLQLTLVDAKDKQTVHDSEPAKPIAETVNTNTNVGMYKYHITVETSKISYSVRVLAEEDSDRIIFEILSGGISVITRELNTPCCDKVVMVVADHEGIILDGFVKGDKKYRYFCNIAGSIKYFIPEVFSGSDEKAIANQ